jgi:hypothetical protein
MIGLYAGRSSSIKSSPFGHIPPSVIRI